MATIKKNAVISSRDRINGTSSSFYVNFPSDTRIRTFRLTRVIIKNTWYVVNATNYSVDFTETDGADTSEASFSLTPGNYTSSNIEVALKAGFDGATKNTRTYTVSTDNTTGFITITGSAGNFELLFGTGTNVSTTIADVIGFTSVDTTPGLSHTSTEFFELGGLDKIFLKSNTLCPSEEGGFITSSDDAHVIGVIGLTSSYGDVQKDEPPDEPVDVYSTAPLSYCDFYLTYSNNVAVELNGSEWYFTATVLTSH